MAEGESGQPELSHDDGDRGPRHVRRGHPRRGPVEHPGHEGQQQPDPAPEVVGVDRHQREEQVHERAVAAAGEVEEQEHQREVDAQRGGEDPARGAGVHGHQREDARLVEPEPDDQGVDVDPMAGTEGHEAEGGQAAHHHDGEQDREQALVALEHPEGRGPARASGGGQRHGGHTIMRPPRVKPVGPAHGRASSGSSPIRPTAMSRCPSPE